MKLYIKQKVFSWGDKFSVCDENAVEKYHVKGEVFSLGKKLHVYDVSDNELVLIHQKLLALLPRFIITRNGTDVAQVGRKFTFWHPEYTVTGLGWSVKGDPMAHEYNIMSGDKIIAAISKRWFSWGDSYEIDIADDVDELMALCVVLVIDAVLAISRSAAVVSNS